MPKYRLLHTKVKNSWDMAEMPTDTCRTIWLLLIVVVDSEGRAIDNAAWIRSQMFPYETERELGPIQDSIDWLADRKMIIRYAVNGRKYFYVPTFPEHQTGLDKEARSTLPAPPDLPPTGSEPTPDPLQNSSGSDTSTDTSTDTDTSTEAENQPLPAVKNSQVTSRVFKKYESEIGIISPMIADAIKDAIAIYPEDWINRAIQEAVSHNARNWKYIEPILKRWKVDGFQANKNSRKKPEPKTGKDYLDGQLSKYIKH